MATEIWPSAADLGLPANMVRIHRAASIDTGPERELNSIVWDIVHDTEGTMTSDEPELTRADSKIASCHALIGPDGEAVLCVPLNLTAWTPGNDTYAEKSMNLEISGYQSKGYTDAQYKTYAAYHRWAVSKGAKIAPSYIRRSGAATGVLGHQDVPNPNVWGAYGGVSGHTDPGPRFEWNKLLGLIKGGSVMPLDLPYGAFFDSAGALNFPVNGKNIPVNFGFLEYFLTLGRNVPEEKTADRIFNAVRLFGLPVEPEHTDPDGHSRQKFERYKMAYNPKGLYGWELYGEFTA